MNHKQRAKRLIGENDNTASILSLAEHHTEIQDFVFTIFQEKTSEIISRQFNQRNSKLHHPRGDQEGANMDQEGISSKPTFRRRGGWPNNAIGSKVSLLATWDRLSGN